MPGATEKQSRHMRGSKSIRRASGSGAADFRKLWDDAIPVDIHPYLARKGVLSQQTIANHSSPRTTKLYDRRSDEISLDEVEKIAI